MSPYYRWISCFSLCGRTHFCCFVIFFKSYLPKIIWFLSKVCTYYGRWGAHLTIRTFEYSPIITILLGLQSPHFLNPSLFFNLRDITKILLAVTLAAFPPIVHKSYPHFCVTTVPISRHPPINHIRQQLSLNRRLGVDFMCFPLNCILQSQPYNTIKTTLYMSPCLFWDSTSPDPKPTSPTKVEKLSQ